MEIKIRKTTNPKKVPSSTEELGFGRHFSNHMFFMNYSEEKGWHNPRIEPRRALQLDPASIVLHYGQQVFEGLKAYRGADKGIYLFRHEKNFERMNRS